MQAIGEMLNLNVPLMHFVTGLAAFAMGLAVALELKYAVDYRFAPALWFLAAFGFSEGAREWLEMSARVAQEQGATPTLGHDIASLALLVAAFAFLLEYGVRAGRVGAAASPSRLRHWAKWLTVALVVIWGIGAFALHGTQADTRGWLGASGVLARYVLGLPAGFLAAYGFVVQRRQLPADLRDREGRFFAGAAWASIWFAVLDQVIVPRSDLWPSTVVNEEAFSSLVGVPVQLFRMLVMMAGAYCVYRALHSVELARREKSAATQARLLEAEERRRGEAERHSLQLAGLTRELSVLLETTRIVMSRMDLESIAQEAVERIVDLFGGVECGCILLVEPVTGRLEIKACTGIDTPCSQALDLAEVVLKRGRGSVTLRDEPPSVVCAPLNSKTGIIGCLCLSNQHEAGRFTEREVGQVQALANQIAVGIEKAWLYREVKRHEGLLRRMIERVVAAQEEERRRIARELHDETSQVLTALMTGLGALEKTVVTNPGLAQERIRALSELGMRAMEDIERLISDLRPSLLDDLGLVPALRWFVKAHRDSLPIVELDLSLGGKRLAPHLETELFRIAQESLTNISRHAGAKRAKLSLKESSGRVRLYVEDDGVGFDPEVVLNPLSPRPALGLLGMRERADGLGGTMRIEARPGGGSRLIFDIPLMEEAGDEGGAGSIGG